MGGGITILLIAIIGAGYFLYQKLRSENTGGSMTQGRAELTSVLNRIAERRNPNTNGVRQQAAQRNPQQTAQADRHTAARPVPETRPAPNRRLVPASRENITETGPMVYFANDRHGRPDKEYRFNYKKVGGSWRAYILKMPSLEGRCNGSGIIHRLHDSNGYYICWDSPVNTLKGMQNISRRWADCIQEYISTGRFG